MMSEFEKQVRHALIDRDMTMTDLVIIPFNAKFSKNDDDFDAGITWKLKKQDVAEYLIKLGIEGLKRVLTNQGFTESQKICTS